MVKPGITGWAQINYPYGATVEDARHKLEYDLYYVKNYSPFLDLLIILQTMRVLLWPRRRAVTGALLFWGHAVAAARLCAGRGRAAARRRSRRAGGAVSHGTGRDRAVVRRRGDAGGPAAGRALAARSAARSRLARPSLPRVIERTPGSVLRSTRVLWIGVAAL